MNIKQKLASVLIGVTALTGIGMATASAASAETLSRCWVDKTYISPASTMRQYCYRTFTTAEKKAGKVDGTYVRFWDTTIYGTYKGLGQWSAWHKVY